MRDRFDSSPGSGDHRIAHAASLPLPHAAGRRHTARVTFLLAPPRATDEPIRLPDPPADRSRHALPIAAAIVPVIGAFVMWTVTGSAFILWFAALGPLMLVAGIIDRGRTAKRERRRYQAMLVAAAADARAEIAERHAADRAERRAMHPDLARLCGDPAETWRPHVVRENTIVVGSGTVPCQIEIARGGDPGQSAQLRELAETLHDAPVVVPADGICVRGHPTVAHAVARALLLQLCILHPPESLRVVQAGTDEPWIGVLPHTASGAARAAALLPPNAPQHAVQVPIAWAPPGGPIPAGCHTVIDLDQHLAGTLQRGAQRSTLACEAVSADQALAVARGLAGRAAVNQQAEAVVHLGELTAQPRGVLGVAVGSSAGATAWLDLVEDGPHAVVVGTTGAGKSEFLISWAVALCRSRSPREVVLMLADFKGGTAFAALETVPHVLGVLTDLDGALAERAVRSLAAEVRRREAVIARAGARDIADPRVVMPRLVVMIDEFPALIAQHPGVEAVFTDIAARGRALGMHLVLGAQRVSGAVREATLANVPLRIALRTAGDADSTAVIGTTDAAAIPGTPAGRGVAFVRRSGDGAPVRTRMALTAAADIAAVCTPESAAEVAGIDPPWLPPLPLQLPQTELVARWMAAEPEARSIPIGVADDPDHQRQPLVSLTPGERGVFVVGRSRSGKSAVIDLIAAAADSAVVVPPDPELAWDVLERLEREAAPLVLCDDLDVLLAAWPEPWGSEAAARWEALVRSAGPRETTFVFTAQRLSGAAGRIAELLPRRAVLAMGSRAEHLTAGGESETFAQHRPPGRADLDGMQMQFGLVPERSAPAVPPQDARHPWSPKQRLTGVVLRSGRDRLLRRARAWQAGALDLADLPAGTDLSGMAATVLFGDPEQWQRVWPVLDAVRRTGELIIAAECAPDVRMLTGERTLLPYARPGNAWSLTAGAPTHRISWS